MASALLEQAEVLQKFGPLAPRKIETWAEAESAIIIGSQKGIDSIRPVLRHIQDLLLKGGQSADAAADNNADIVPVAVINRQIGLFDGLLAGDYRKLGEAVHPAGFFAVDIISRIKSFDLTGKPGGEFAGIKGVMLSMPDLPATRLPSWRRYPAPGG